MSRVVAAIVLVVMLGSAVSAWSADSRVYSADPAQLGGPSGLGGLPLNAPARRTAPEAGTASDPVDPWAERAIPVYSTVGGGDLAISQQGDTELVHAVVSNLEDALPRGWDASAYVRSRDQGMTWSKPRLLEGLSPQVAAAGRHVYLAFEAYRCGGGIGFMRNADGGARRSWSSVVCLSTSNSLDSRWRPVVAAAGRFVYVAAVEKGTRRVRMRVSRDRGRTWTVVSLGVSLGRNSWDGVRLVAKGRTVAVGWGRRGKAVARVSDDRGRSWSERVRLALGTVSSGATRHSLIAFSGYRDDGSPWLKVRADGAFANVPLPMESLAFPITWNTATVIGPDGTIAMVMPDCSSADPEAPRETHWMTTSDHGQSWDELAPMPHCGADDVSWTPAGRKFVLHYARDGYSISVHP